MSAINDDAVLHYEKELGWVPPFVRLLAEHAPEALDGYMAMRKAVLQEPPEGALPRKTKELLFTILDSVMGEQSGAKAHARAAVDAGLTMRELAEGFAIALMVTGITTLTKAGAEAMTAAQARLRESEK
jgi:alkylhydroperoxidase/carboxymuconolactone decarboxylase family protein YurZ